MFHPDVKSSQCERICRGRPQHVQLDVKSSRYKRICRERPQHDVQLDVKSSRYKRMCRGRPRHNVTSDGNFKESSYTFIYLSSLCRLCAVDIHGNIVTVKIIKAPNGR
ncbi:hypothetical protein EVAR_93779_1 [Eumeta japonica]|uniref:Uncharacterized protein n=1 Tax=Eumeta variegata TaxID=151549 RepID=A0A4C1VCT9_EUMVA|nr:hypothetical protein EVAR_93779_1 [Eumeta japonica]